jgi:hypothetical protein
MSGNLNLSKAAFYRILDNKIKDTYVFQFNFPELGRSHNAEFNLISPPGSTLPTAIYKSTPGQDFTISLMVDSSSYYSETGVLSDLAYFESLVLPDIDTYVESNARWLSPDRLMFVVGNRLWDVICLSVSIKETRYQRDLIPNRATVDITLKTIYVDQASIVTYLDNLRLLYSTRVVSTNE